GTSNHPNRVFLHKMHNLHNDSSAHVLPQTIANEVLTDHESTKNGSPKNLVHMHIRADCTALLALLETGSRAMFLWRAVRSVKQGVLSCSCSAARLGNGFNSAIRSRSRWSRSTAMRCDWESMRRLRCRSSGRSLWSSGRSWRS